MKNYKKNLKGMEGMKVRVYRNLTDKCLSVRCMKTGRVIAHVSSIVLEDVTFPVGQKQLRRVIETGHKNVHAFVQGYISTRKRLINKRSVSYNPTKQPIDERGYFFYRANGREIKNASFADVRSYGCQIQR